MEAYWEKAVNPNVYIIAGPNGAGKTTFATKFLPKYANCRVFINADLIAQGLSPFAPERMAFRSGRLMLEEIEAQAERGEDFGFETTLSGKGHVGVVKDLKKRQYEVHIFYLWIPSAELALARIRDRVLRGGHDVAADVVQRRFGRSIRNFLRLYRALADRWILFDNSGAALLVIALKEEGHLRAIEMAQYNEIVARYGSR